MTLATTQPVAPPRRKRAAVIAIKLIVTLALCAFIIWNTDFAHLAHTLRSANAWLLGVVVVMMFLSVPLSAYKWRQTLLIHNIRVPFRDLHRWYYTAVLFNNFLPTNIGGDGYRLFRTLGNGYRRAGALSAILVERISGVLVLLVMGFAAACYRLTTPGDHPLSEMIVVYGLIAGGAAALALLVLFRSRVLAAIARRQHLPKLVRAGLELLKDFRTRPGRTSWACGGVSIIFHVHTIAFYYILMAALHDPPQVTGLVIMLAVAAVAGVLPISINGIGLVDGVFIYAARRYGVGYEVALSTMLLVRAVNVLISLVGAWFYFAGGASTQKIHDALETPSIPEQTHAAG